MCVNICEDGKFNLNGKLAARRGGKKLGVRLTGDGKYLCLTEDEFHEMYLCCYEVSIRRDDYARRVGERILARRKWTARENAQLYRKPGNIQLDQNIGDTPMQMSERIDLSDWDEWDR